MISIYKNFKGLLPLDKNEEDRNSSNAKRLDVQKIINKYPYYRPVMLLKAQNSSLEDIKQKKYIVPCEVTLGQFMYIIRKKIKIRPEQAIFLFIGDRLTNNSSTIGELYEELKSDDGMLYVQYTEENVFG
jgi:GABA(A) receptor-associated protein